MYSQTCVQRTPSGPKNCGRCCQVIVVQRYLYAMKKMKNFLSFETMKLLYYSFFHSHLEFSSTFLMLTSNKNIDKIESLQKKAIRLLMGLPRISHTAEAFWALNILPFRKLGIFNVIKFLGFSLYPLSLFLYSPFENSAINNLQTSKTYFVEPCRRLTSVI